MMSGALAIKVNVARPMNLIFEIKLDSLNFGAVSIPIKRSSTKPFTKFLIKTNASKNNRKKDILFVLIKIESVITGTRNNIDIIPMLIILTKDIKKE